MLSQHKINALKRIKEEYISINKNINFNAGVKIGIADEDNYFQWRITFNGPQYTSYIHDRFAIFINFQDDFPNSKPKVVFRTLIYHVNVNPNKTNMPGADPLGHVGIPILNLWKPEYKMLEVLADIFGLFYTSNLDSPYGIERVNEFRFNKALHDEKVKYFTKKYADPRYADINKEYFESWDFTYD